MGEPTKRDVKNHLLFEISTETANRGKDFTSDRVENLSPLMLHS